MGTTHVTIITAAYHLVHYLCLFKFLCLYHSWSGIVCAQMDYAAKFAALAREELPPMNFALQFSQLTLKTALNDETLKLLDQG